MDLSATIEIGCPPDEVWAFVSDVRNDSRWRSGIVESGLLSPPPLALGTKGFARAEAGEVQWVVRAIEPGRSVDWELETGPIKGHGGYRLDPVGDATRFTLVADVTATGMYRLLGPIFGWIGRRQNEKDVAVLKGILEGESKRASKLRRPEVP